MNIIGGIDIGGTKCAVVLATIEEGSQPKFLYKKKYETPALPENALKLAIEFLNQGIRQYSAGRIDAIGVSCGGPLDSQAGVILAPPNLPHWRGIPVVSFLSQHFNVPVSLLNDADACALAEWKWGAGKGFQNVIFLTFGTGMGAGMILNGKLYTGANGMAGEVGHIRLNETGPVGYGKEGSFEGYCSGGGIARLSRDLAREWLQKGKTTILCSSIEDIDSISAASVGEAAAKGDALASEVWKIVGRQLGRGLAILVDVLNPERIIIGSIYPRQQSLLEPVMLEELEKEALPLSLSTCEIVPAALGEQVGDFGSLSVGIHAYEQRSQRL
jgi:glucokinase